MCRRACPPQFWRYSAWRGHFRRGFLRSEARNSSAGETRHYTLVAAGPASSPHAPERHRDGRRTIIGRRSSSSPRRWPRYRRRRADHAGVVGRRRPDAVRRDGLRGTGVGVSRRPAASTSSCARCARRLAGFLWGWAMFWSMHCGIIAAIAMVFARYADLLRAAGRHAASARSAIALILVLSALNYLGVKPGSRVQTALTVAKVAAIVILVVAGLALSSGSAVSPSAGPATSAARRSPSGPWSPSPRCRRGCSSRSARCCRSRSTCRPRWRCSSASSSTSTCRSRSPSARAPARSIARPSPARSPSTTSGSATPPRATGPSPAPRSRCRAAPRPRSWARPARARPRWATCSRASMTPSAAG